MDRPMVAAQDTPVEREPAPEKQIRVGRWYWYTPEADEDDQDKPERILWCVTHIGSNYVLLDSPYHRAIRLHLDKADQLREEPDPSAIWRQRTDEAQHRVRLTVDRIEKLCLRLGLNPERAPQDGGETALVVAGTGGADVKAYKRALVKAQDKELPALFEELKEATEHLSTTMKAEALPLEAYADTLGTRLDLVKGRIFNVELYGGLHEQVKQIARGNPAPIGEKIALMQRTAYMDEECLLDYEAGGMDFQRLPQFDRWLARRHNMERLLPFPRCVLAMRVRRNPKDYGPLHPFIAMHFDKENLATYLAVRNGDRLYRLATAIDFGDKLFPDHREFDFGQQLYAEMEYGDRVERIYTEGEVEQLKGEARARMAELEEWKKAHHGDDHWLHAPWRLTEASRELHALERLARFSPEDVRFDDIKKHIDNQIQQYNRMILVIQGLLDRSDVFHPHPPLKLWVDRDMEFIRPVYDADRALHGGTPPDFEAYSAGLNESITVGTRCIGQRAYWHAITVEPDKRETRTAVLPYKRWPYNANGPRAVAVVRRVNRRRQLYEFVWQRQTWNRYRGEGVANCRMWVPRAWLFNVDAYRPGDYKRFFADPRTRGQYLRWAPTLLTAEAAKAGKDEEDGE